MLVKTGVRYFIDARSRAETLDAAQSHRRKPQQHLAALRQENQIIAKALLQMEQEQARQVRRAIYTAAIIASLVMLLTGLAAAWIVRHHA